MPTVQRLNVDLKLTIKRSNFYNGLPKPTVFLLFHDIIEAKLQGDIHDCISSYFRKIKAYDTIIIHCHQRPDPDAIGSQVGLKEILKQTFQIKVLAAGVNEPTLSWIAEMDEVADQDYEGALVIVTDTANTLVSTTIVMIKVTSLSKLTIILTMMPTVTSS